LLSFDSQRENDIEDHMTTTDQVAALELCNACRRLDRAIASRDNERSEEKRVEVVLAMAKLLAEFGCVDAATSLETIAAAEFGEDDGAVDDELDVQEASDCGCDSPSPSLVVSPNDASRGCTRSCSLGEVMGRPLIAPDEALALAQRWKDHGLLDNASAHPGALDGREWPDLARWVIHQTASINAIPSRVADAVAATLGLSQQHAAELCNQSQRQAAELLFGSWPHDVIARILLEDREDVCQGTERERLEEVARMAIARVARAQVNYDRVVALINSLDGTKRERLEEVARMAIARVARAQVNCDRVVALINSLDDRVVALINSLDSETPVVDATIRGAPREASRETPS
jgi:hypothetical protein